MILLLVLFVFNFAELTVGRDARVVGGDIIPITEAPYQVSLRIINYDITRFGSGFFCGGSIISISVVLTAAHCMYDVKNQLVSPSLLQVAGGHASLFERDSHTFISAVSSFKVHELYAYGQSFDHDIAVIKLKTKIYTNSKVKIINLPTNTYPVGSSCLISGWGKIRREGPVSDVLRGAYIPINNVSQCNLPIYYNGSVRSGMLCAGSFAGGTNVCQGDSGGALNCDNIVYGITSHGIDCAIPRYPGIFTDVFYYRDWILKNRSHRNRFNVIVILSVILIVLDCH